METKIIRLPRQEIETDQPPEAEISFTLSEVISKTGLSRQLILGLVDAKYLSASKRGNRWCFYEPDLVILDGIKQARDSVSGRERQSSRIVAAIRRAQSQRSPNVSTQDIHVVVLGNKLGIYDGTSTYDPLTKQVGLDLEEITTPEPKQKPVSAEIVPFILPGGLDVPDSDASSEVAAILYNKAQELDGLDDDRAMHFYQKAIDAERTNVSAALNLGRLYQSYKKDLERAKKLYEFVLEIDPKHQLAQYNLGTLWDWLDETDKAIECYKKASNVVESYYNLSVLYSDLDRREEAIRYYKIYCRLHEANDELDED